MLYLQRALPIIAVQLSLGVVAYAGPLTEARVNKIINEVSVVDTQAGARPAKLNDVVNQQAAVKTGIKSRSELLFQDNTLTRIGPESFFSFTPGTRDMELKEGTMLLQVPKGLGGAKIRTAAVTAAITGTTIMIEHRPGKNLKVLVLEGSLRLSVNGRFGDSLLLTPGKMVIMAPSAKRIPDPVSVDLAQVMKTSSLVTMGGGSSSATLPSVALIEKEIALQVQDKGEHRLIETNLVIDGSGTNVVLAKLDRKATASDPTIASGGTLPTPVPAISPLPNATPNPVGTPLPIATPVPVTTPAPGATPLPITTPAPTAAPLPTATPAPTPTYNDDDDSEDEFNDVVNINSHGNGAGPVTMSTPIDLSTNGRSGKVKVRAAGTVTVNTTVKVSGSTGPTPSTRGGKIDLKSDKSSGVAINVTSSAQLLSLLNAAAPGPGGTIKFSASGGAINVTGSTLQADRGLIDIKNNGDGAQVSLSGANLRADTVKIRTMGQNGQLNIGGGTISADTLISLYSEGSNGTVNFIDNVTLSGNSVKTISGNTVTIVNGKVVNIAGPAPASVFTNNPNYTGSGGNGSTTGTFGGQGATTAPLSSGSGH